MAERDLFGDLVPPPTAPNRGPKGGKNYTKQKGYAAQPGSGPAGQSCGTCKHLVRTKRYRKCRLMAATWSHGPGTDVLARSPACARWEKAEAPAPVETIWPKS